MPQFAAFILGIAVGYKVGKAMVYSDLEDQGLVVNAEDWIEGQRENAEMQ